MKTNNQRGVTLMELLVVIVVLGILTSIAYPSYRSYLLRAQRAEAKTALLQLQAGQEKFYLNGNTYTENVTAPSPDGLGLSGTTETGKYTITVDFGIDGDGQSYTATAAPAAGGGQEDDTLCGSFTITDTGVRDNVDATLSSAECWR
jgi:type IV pilus assembly protein PilE